MTLIFATCYVDSDHRQRLFEHWMTLTTRLNPDADILVVDSHSPRLELGPEFVPYSRGLRSRRMLHSFSDNIGHLSRGGRDGWGRAFCFGLDAAVASGYRHVVHIEGDSLFRLPVQPIVEFMDRERINVLSTPVEGTTVSMPGWVETGLMFFRVAYLITSQLTQRYDWRSQRGFPTPEIVIRNMLDKDLHFAPWKATRGDKSQIDRENILSLDLDWVTHCWSEIEVYDQFLEAALLCVADQ